jgi:hypothetical protein
MFALKDIRTLAAALVQPMVTREGGLYRVALEVDGRVLADSQIRSLQVQGVRI